MFSVKSESLLLPTKMFLKELSDFFVYFVGLYLPIMMIDSMKKIKFRSKDEESTKGDEDICLLDLPELVLDSIIEKLPPSSLCSMAGVCSSLRNRCVSDYVWAKHLKEKWGNVIGDVAYKKWREDYCQQIGLRPLCKGSSIAGLLRSLWFWSKPECETKSTARTSLPVDSIMALFMSLESGQFWFPAQVYNRENGHVGFMLSCYDASLRYDSRTDSFQARYSSYGRRMVEDNVQWERIRAPPVDTPANVLHSSDCLSELQPGDHVEIQWRKSKEFPYGWWYAVVGHQDSCDWNESSCHCAFNDTVVLEFKQYKNGSRWRKKLINRKDHQEEGDEIDGFYGGIRKIYKHQEISTWRKLWPSQVLD